MNSLVLTPGRRRRRRIAGTAVRLRAAALFPHTVPDPSAPGPGSAAGRAQGPAPPPGHAAVAVADGGSGRATGPGSGAVSGAGSVPGPEPESDREPAGEPGPERPVPGRRERWRLALLERLPAAVRLRCGLELRTVAALGLLALVAVAFAVHHFWSGRPEAVDVPRATSTRQPPAPPPGATPAPAPGPSAGPGRVIVDIVGKVRDPGVRGLPAGSRVGDALKSAGGALPGTDTSTLNLARVLVDGEQIAVGRRPAAPAPSEATAGTGGSGPGAGPVSLSTATPGQLDALPGVGPVLAQHIIDYRVRHGGFASVDQLREVNGIGERRFSDLKPLVVP